MMHHKQIDANRFKYHEEKYSILIEGLHMIGFYIQCYGNNSQGGNSWRKTRIERKKLFEGVCMYECICMCDYECMHCLCLCVNV